MNPHHTTPIADTRPAALDTDGRPHGFGRRLLDDDTRARLHATASHGRGPTAVLARIRLRTDDNRRAAQRAARTGEAVRVSSAGALGPGGGRCRSVGTPVEYRGTTAQVAGLWPWCVGAGAPLVGTPLGRHLDTGAPVCFDPMNWFTRGGFLTAPSLFVLGLNGFGKSSLVRRIVLGGIAQGITPLILADVKPDYRALVQAVGGQVIDLGYGHGTLNPLDPGVMGNVLTRLQDEGHTAAADTLRAELRARHTNLIAALVELVRGERIADFEDTLISTGLRILHTPSGHGGAGFTVRHPPIIADLLAVIERGGDELRLDAAAATPEVYDAAVVPLRRSLRALIQGPFGQVFNGPTSTAIDTDSVAVCVDVSHIPKGDKKLKAAVMLACWASGFGAVEALNLLTDLGLAPQRYFQVVLDELWQVLGLGEFMVERVDELTRLQRGIATALIMISHTIKDLQSLGSDAAIGKALGFLERARAKVFGALPAEEIKRLDPIVPFTDAEAAMVTSWSAPQALTGEAVKRDQPRPLPPGMGKFLLKIGEDRSPGIGFTVEIGDIEREAGIHETSGRFLAFGRPDTPQQPGGDGCRFS